MKVVEEKKEQLQKQVCRQSLLRPGAQRPLYAISMPCRQRTAYTVPSAKCCPWDARTRGLTCFCGMQIEFYFSDSNLPFDKFLKEQCSTEGGCAVLLELCCWILSDTLLNIECIMQGWTYRLLLHSVEFKVCWGYVNMRYMLVLPMVMLPVHTM